MSLRIYNTLTRELESFSPLQAGHVRMYVCGMTVYDYCHIGHARVMVVFDMVQRWLRASGMDVTYVRNITDIDDKIIKRAVENGETIKALTQRFIDAMHEDERNLFVLPPDIEPKATQSIADIINLIEMPKFMELITNEKRYELLIAFNKVRKEFRNEKLTILFILNFLFLNPEMSLENISFI